MFSQNILPGSELQEYIFRYRIRHFYFNGANAASLKPFPPQPEQCLIFYPRGAETIKYSSNGSMVQRPRSVVSGQYTERINRLITTAEFLMISVEFKPGALFRLTGINSSEFTNQCVDAETCFTDGLFNVNNRLSESDSYKEMIFIIEEFLKTIVRKSSGPAIAADIVLDGLINNSDICNVDELAKRSYLSPRQLERKLLERTGVCPKTFLKLARFNRSLSMRLSKPRQSWLSIAIESGYSDYQHLAKEYKTFTCNSPNLFLEEEMRSPGRVLGLTK